MAALRLAWLLVRRSTGIRRWGMVAAATIGVLLVTLVLALPDAYLTGDAVKADRLVLSIVGIFLLVPVGVLLLAVSRLSAATKDRRLATLRMLGLTPRRTRWVTALENGLLALAGSVVGVLGSLVVSRLVSQPLIGAGALRRPLDPGVPLAVAVAGLVVVLTSVISLAPTRRLDRNAMALKHIAAEPPSWWRVLPLAVGVVGAAILLAQDPPGSGGSGQRFFVVSMACVVSAGVGVLVALPLVTRGLAEALARSSRPTLRLAGRRMQFDPSATTRVVAGLAISLFLVTGATEVLAAFQNTPQYLAEKHSIEVGPQYLLLLGDGLRSEMASERDRVRGVEGVTRVVPRYAISVARTGGQSAGRPYNVFYGTCADLAALHQGVLGCHDDRVSWLRTATHDAPFAPPTDLAAPVRIEANMNPAESGGPTVEVRPSENIIDLPNWSWYGIGGSFQDGLFVPLGTPNVADLGAVPMMAYIVMGPGYEVRERLSALDLKIPLDGLSNYESTNSWQLVVWSLLALALIVGLVAVLITAIDRATERRGEVAAQVAMGVPARTLRLSQSIQVASPTGMAIFGSILTGHLSAVSFLHSSSPLLQTVPARTLGVVLGAAAVSLAIMALATLTGISSRLTPELLRRE